jgi:hypothetical protein
MSSRKLKCVAARGRKISDKTVLRLFAAASGRCERPECQTGWLWHELPNGDAVRLGEVAHIVAASDDGPRGDSAVSTAELVSVDNLILLCPTCHTIVDGAPDEYPTERLKQWKSEHESRVRAILQVERFATRPQAHRELQRLLAQNAAVWSVYGPDSPASVDPESAGTWLREVAEVILPTNARISALLEVNAELLTADEHEVVGLFDAHRRGMEARHLGIDVGVAAPRFPAAIKTVFSDVHDDTSRGDRDA